MVVVNCIVLPICLSPSPFGALICSQLNRNHQHRLALSDAAAPSKDEMRMMMVMTAAAAAAASVHLQVLRGECSTFCRSFCAIAPKTLIFFWWEEKGRKKERKKIKTPGAPKDVDCCFGRNGKTIRCFQFGCQFLSSCVFSFLISLLSFLVVVAVDEKRRASQSPFEGERALVWVYALFLSLGRHSTLLLLTDLRTIVFSSSSFSCSRLLWNVVVDEFYRCPLRFNAHFALWSSSPDLVRLHTHTHYYSVVLTSTGFCAPTCLCTFSVIVVFSLWDAGVDPASKVSQSVEHKTVSFFFVGCSVENTEQRTHVCSLSPLAPFASAAADSMAPEMDTRRPTDCLSVFVRSALFSLVVRDDFSYSFSPPPPPPPLYSHSTVAHLQPSLSCSLHHLTADSSRETAAAVSIAPLLFTFRVCLFVCLECTLPLPFPARIFETLLMHQWLQYRMQHHCKHLKARWRMLLL